MGKYTEKQLKRILVIESKQMRYYSFKRSCKTADLNPNDFAKTFLKKEEKSQNSVFSYKLIDRAVFEEEVKTINPEKNIYRKVLKELEAMLQYVYEGRVIIVDGNVLESDSREIIKPKKSICTFVNKKIKDCGEQNEDFCEINEKHLAFILLAECKKKIDKKTLMFMGTKEANCKKLAVFKKQEEIIRKIK
ncbi:MAG: hypothetical protein ACRCZ9_01610 [Fusobacteriaceae bacterium]